MTDRTMTNIYVYNGDDFVAHLRTLPNDEAVKLANQAMRGDNQRQNQPALLRNRAFSQWLVDMAECGLV